MSQPFEDAEWIRPPEEEKLDFLQEQAAFFQDIADLISLLPGVKQAETETHTFSFTVLPFSTPLEFPAAIKPFATQIDDFSIYLGGSHVARNPEDTDTPASLSIDFLVGTTIYTVSRSGEGSADSFILTRLKMKDYSHAEPNEVFEGRVSEVASVSGAELNAFIMSIVLPNTNDDYSAYNDKELQSSSAFESLNELLGAKALSQTDTYHFMLNDEETDIHFTKEYNQVTSVTITYYDRIRNIPVTVEYDLGTEFVLRFFTIIKDAKQPFTPTAEEVNYLRQILSNDLREISPDRFSVVRSIEGSNEDDDDGDRGAVMEPESPPVDNEHLLTNELSGLVDKALDQLGLNPSNPSA